MQVHPLTPVLGADVTGIDVTALDAGAFGALREALVRHGVIVIRDQSLTPHQQLAFAERFGAIHLHPHVEGLPHVPQIMEVLKTETDTKNFGSEWHTDQSFLDAPAMATCLYALEVPDAGGDTLFACLRNAWRTLSPGMQRLALDLRTENLSVAAQLARRGAENAATYGSMRARNAAADEPAAKHPLVCRHPDSGEPALYLGLHTRSFAGFTTDESRPLIDVLMRHVTRPENTCRVRWRPGSLTVWDNRSVLHNALNDYPGKRRRMHRITIAGTRPVAWGEAGDAIAAASTA